jgi:hypothetical protein
MKARILKIWPLPATIAIALGVAGCGQSTGSHSPNLAGVPLTGGTRVVFHVRRCDRGANPYCAIQLVVVGNHYRTSTALQASERRHLKALGWGMADADTGDEHGADSPGHTLRLTYATAALDLKDIDLGWVQRSPRIARSLSRTMFARSSALSLMLETGSS